MGNLTSCVSKKVQRDSIDLMQTLFDDMEKRLMACIKAELTQSRSSNNGSRTPPIPAPSPLTRQEAYID